MSFSVMVAVLVSLLLVGHAGGTDTVIGTLEAEVLSKDDQFFFELNPSTVPCDFFLFAFKEFEITGFAQLLMYEQGVSLPFFTCIACGNIIPPVFYSSVGVVTVRIDGVNGASFIPSRFKLQYVGQISDPQDVDITSSHTNYNILLHMPYGHIRPVLMGGRFLSGLSKQTWTISVNTDTIQFSLGFLNFEAGANGLCGATLTIYDGLTTSSPVLYSGCNWVSIPEYFIYTSTGNALVVLESVSTAILEVDFLLDYLSDDELYHCGSATTPDILKSNSMSIVDGSKSTNFMRRAESCEWLINPFSNSSVTLLFSWVSIKPGASVVVYDNNTAGGVVLWDSSGTFTTVPPPLTSTGNSLYIVFSGNTLLATDYFGFNGEYYSRHADSPGTGSAQELYSMSSAIGITLPDTVSGKYRESFLYSFLIKPLSSQGTLYIVINKLNIADCDDSIRIYDGVSSSSMLLSSLCGTSAPLQWIAATSGSALLEFSTDSDQLRSGEFDFSYYSDGSNYHCGFPTNPAVLISPSMTLTDGSSSWEGLYQNQYCEWIIEPYNAEGIALYFERLDLSGGGSLQVYDGVESSATLLLNVSSVAAIPLFVTTTISNKMKLVYSSSSSLVGNSIGNGFSATYFSINSQISGPGSDGIIRLFSSSSNSFGLPAPVTNANSYANNYSFLIQPPSLNSSLYIQVQNVSIASCHETLKLFKKEKSEILMEFTCENFRQSDGKGFWLDIPEGEAMIEFQSVALDVSQASQTLSSFDVAYFSEGSTQHCGILSNPGRLTASSMPFSDGSGYNSPMHGGDECEWLIENRYDEEITNYIIEFSVSDLRGGGQLYIYDGSSDKSDLLWSCIECTETPQAIITSSNVAFIRFFSPSVENVNDEFVFIGEGFHANYWAIKKSDDVVISASTLDYKIMTLPEGYFFEADAMPNGTAGWVLGISEEMSTMTYSPSYTFDLSSNFSSTSGDATYLDYSRKEMKPSAFSCGFVQAAELTTLRSPLFTAAATQLGRASVDTVLSQKRSLEIFESKQPSSFKSSNLTTDTTPLKAASTCTYIIDTGSNMQSATIWIRNLNSRVNGRLRVFGGIYGFDVELLDSTGSVDDSVEYFLPCGRGTIMLDSNLNGTEEFTDSLLDYYFEMSFQLTTGDNGTDCARYYDDLFGSDKKENFFVKYASAFIILFLIAILFCVCVMCPELIPKSWKNMYKRNVREAKKRYKVARAPRPHPPFTPKIDGFRNKYMLQKGECCVCKVNTEKVLKLTGCSHVICLEDLNGYICTALGDVSMFPLKCPMHIDSCTSTITPLDAKRVLLEPQYDKFLEFTDRGLYGEGMRCIFCANYVKFPAATKIDQMRCMKCYQSFCIRCKGPWHYGRRCVVDAIDETLESWKVASGAQKCPGCSKLIEKDDPSTCHHMIHKVSDGIPCCRERTDFCYLCGVEVKPDYPHDEVKNPGVNHFPEGVFQRCRTIINKERDIEREFLRKAKRRQTSRAMNRVQPVLFEESSFSGIENGTVDLASETPVVSNDPFDVMWSDSPVRERLDAEFSEYA